MPTAPSRRTSEAQINQFNLWMRQQPWYESFFKSRGLNPNRVSLSRGEQSALEQLLKFNGVGLPDGMHIDQAGNVNQKNTLARNIGIGAAIGGGALTGLGFAGIGPLSGALGGGGAAAGGAAGTIPTIPSTAIGSGLGYAPASLAGTSAIPSAMAATATAGGIPTLASRAIGNGMGTDPVSIGSGSINAPGIPTIPSRQIGSGMGTDPSLGDAAGGLLGGVGSALKSLGGSDLIKNLLKYGLPAAGAFGAGRMLGGDGLDIPPPPAPLSSQDVIKDMPHLQELIDLNSAYARRTNMQQERADPLLGAAQQLAMNLLPRTAFGPLTPQRKLGS